METCDVIIVGSGVAGLTTARHLADVYGITNTILVEAADYVGGCVCARVRECVCCARGAHARVEIPCRRVKQDRTFMKGKEIEVGAEFMHGDTTPLMDLVRKHKLNLWWLCTWAQVRTGARC